MFLGKEDIQLGVNESLRDTAIVISSMVSAMMARVGSHSDVVDLAKHSTVPVINALSDDFHPLQTVADFLTIYEAFQSRRTEKRSTTPGLGLEGLKIAWIGDANNGRENCPHTLLLKLNHWLTILIVQSCMIYQLVQLNWVCIWPWLRQRHTKSLAR